MTMTGGCHCGAVRYEASGAPDHYALCCCTDCRKSAGAPLVGWALFRADAVKIEGEAQEYASSDQGRRHFCAACGTGLFYTNEQIFAGKIDIQGATLDDPDALAPQAVIQTADAPAWLAGVRNLPHFERYPG